MPGRIWAYLIGTNESHTDEAVSMRVSMVAVRRMRVGVSERRGHLPMAMCLTQLDGSLMRMIVMVVVCMTVFVHKLEMFVNMLVAFAEMQPDAEGHQRAG